MIAKRIALVVLTVIALAALGCGTYLTVAGHSADVLWGIVGTAVGAIAGILVPTDEQPQPRV